ncbi:MAG: hypothetical protein M1324_00270 [Patescibacteria group bacterium]|nr:hypothetical protein [Patescibacteria group bacterium]
MSSREIIVTEKDGVRIFGLGEIEVDYGIKGDPDRIKNMVGNILFSLDLNPQIFTHLNKWPEGIVKKKLSIVQYVDITDRDLFARNARLEKDHRPLTAFADLTSVLKTDNLLRELLEILYKNGVWRIEATDLVSARLRNGRDYVACFNCDHDYNVLFSRCVSDRRRNSVATLVDEQVL